ncbi:MAG: bile acid:sodium symporter family protein [Polyangiaceae bacterium]
MKRRVDWFLVGLICVSLLAFVWPEPGAHGGALHPELTNKLGVALIFLLHGATLSLSALAEGLKRVRVHVAIQAATFVFFPLLGLALLKLLPQSLVKPELRIGLFFLCALPSTVSSSVTLTAVARGSVPVALFNATLSSLLGVALTPLWIGLALRGSGQTLPLSAVVLDLFCWLVMPFLVGQLLRPWVGGFVGRNKRALSLLDRGTILLLVYTSFCDSVVERVWGGQGPLVLIVTFGVCCLLLALMLLASSYAARLLGVSVEDRIALMFCGSKKTLASGVPMARLMFGAGPSLGVILLPILLYHPLQLVVCGWLAGRFARRAG